MPDHNFGAEPADNESAEQEPQGSQAVNGDQQPQASAADQLESFLEQRSKTPKKRRMHKRSSTRPSVEIEWISIAEGFGLWESSEAAIEEIADDEGESGGAVEEEQARDTTEKEIPLEQWVEFNDDGGARFFGAINERGDLTMPVSFFKASNLRPGTVLFIQAEVVKRRS